jgi:hypothetical protein
MDDKKHERNRQYVKKCRNKQSLETKQRINQNYCKTWNGWISRHTYASLIEDRNKNRDGNITVDYIAKLSELQKYKCCVTNVDLTHDKSLWSLSIDRIDNNFGHIIGNIQLTCMGVNLAKNRHINGDVKYFIECIKNNNLFVPNKLSRDYVSTLIRNAKNRDNSFDNDINTDWIFDLLDKQGGRCALTNIRLAGHKHPCLSLSIDRINSKLWYIKSNIQLVVKAINRAKGKREDAEVIKWIDDIRRNK